MGFFNREGCTVLDNDGEEDRHGDHIDDPFNNGGAPYPPTVDSEK
jgi:hypothetical protein